MVFFGSRFVNVTCSNSGPQWVRVRGNVSMSECMCDSAQWGDIYGS